MPDLTKIQINNTLPEGDGRICVSGSAAISNGLATVDIKIPGTFANKEGRYFIQGFAFFDTQGAGDKIKEISIIDKDNLLGFGANTIVANFTGKAALAEENQGWYVPVSTGIIATQVANFGFIPSGLYLRVVGVKNLGILQSACLYVNLSLGIKA